jgi:hypothetical protein
MGIIVEDFSMKMFYLPLSLSLQIDNMYSVGTYIDTC